MRLPVLLVLLVAASPALAEGRWSASLLPAWTLEGTHPSMPSSLSGSYGLLAAGYRQVSPLLGLGVELGYGRFAYGSVQYPGVQACIRRDCTEIGTAAVGQRLAYNLLQVSAAIRVRGTEGPLRPRLSFAVGGYGFDGTNDETKVYRDAAGTVVRTESHRYEESPSGGPGVGVTAGVDFLPFDHRSALTAELRVHMVATTYSGGFNPTNVVQAGLGYTFW